MRSMYVVRQYCPVFAQHLQQQTILVSGCLAGPGPDGWPCGERDLIFAAVIIRADS